MASQREEWPSPTGADPRKLCDPLAHHGDQLGVNLDRPALALRARVFARRRSLDEELAEGASPLRTPELALRARQLVSQASRQRVATHLERLVKEAKRAAPPPAVAVPLPRREILEAQTWLLGIAACLGGERPVYARGMALLSLLLSDGRGPAYNPYPGEALFDAVRAAAAGLDGRWPAGCST